MRALTAASVAVMALLIAAAVPATAIFGSPKQPFPFPLLMLKEAALGGSHNGGSKCAACTLLVGLVEQQMQLKQIDAMQSMQDMCSYLPISLVADACSVAIDLYGDKIAPILNSGESADTVCNGIGMCGTEAPVCRLFPKKHGRTEGEFEAHTRSMRAEAVKKDLVGKFNICELVPGVCRVEDHLPFWDTDKDHFSTHETLRGSDWRGKDCNDNDATIYPGRDTSDAVVDANCNGIFGTDPTTGATYEDQWCKGTNPMGVAVLGDSATAHFHIPPTYVTAANLSKATFAHLIRNAENELDWPMLSWSTGHLNPDDFKPDISGPKGSLYSHMLDDNLCMHRDYQNLGVNGAKVDNLLPFDMLLQRNASQGVKPVVLIMSMIGNDVCHWDHTFRTMTKPEEYRASVIAALEEADKFLPAGSQVVLIPLVDGRILYDTMHDRIHPIGETNKDVTYADLYNYLNCLEVSPCWGWMNGNETVRNTTWEVASSLNAQLPIIANQSAGKYANFDVHFLGNIFDTALQTYKAKFPATTWELIEPVDGFHPSQKANALLGGYLYNATKAAGILPGVNPNNANIKAKFGDQGGY